MFAGARISGCAYPSAISHDPMLADTSLTSPGVNWLSETPSTSFSTGVL